MQGGAKSYPGVQGAMQGSGGWGEDCLPGRLRELPMCEQIEARRGTAVIGTAWNRWAGHENLWHGTESQGTAREFMARHGMSKHGT